MRRVGGICLLFVVVAVAGWSFSTLATAETPPADTSLHLVVVPDTPAGEGALQLSVGAREVARYASFTLVEASGDDVARLTEAGGSVRDDMREVRIGRQSSDPTIARPALGDKTGAGMRLAGKGGRGMAVVQYVGPLKDAWIAAVRKTGVEVVTYMAQNGQLVIGDDAALARLAELKSAAPFVRAVTPYTAADKKYPGLARSGRTRVVVSTVAGDAGADARARLSRISTRRADDVTVANYTHQRVTVDAAEVDALAEVPGVLSIEPEVEPRLHDERAAMIVAGNLNASFQPVLGTGYRSFLSTNGFLTNSPVWIDITDSGVDKGVVPVPAGSHPDFYNSGSTANTSRIRYAHEATAADTNARDCGGHGTNVASIASGYNALTGATNEDAQGFNYGLGIAPYVKLGATKIFNCAGSFDVTTSLTALHSAAYASGARISNNSWGADVNGAYTATSQEFDRLVRDAQPTVSGKQPYTEVFSAGNSGSGGNTIGSPGTAKNVITVGASENARQVGFTDGCGVTDAEANSARDIIDFSSRGPTDDGRTKPDIVAPGTHVTGAQPQTGGEYNGSGTCNPQFPAGSSKYSLVSGTSQAAPEATGFAALLREWYKGAEGGGITYPTPAMIKALMVNTASDVAGGDNGAGGTNGSIPTQISGWGRINLGRVLDGTFRQVVDQSTIMSGTGSIRTYYHNIATSTRPLKITLAWTDAPGPTTGNAFVNDLNLEVTAGGAIYKGNVFSGGVSTTGGTADPRNNVENVFLPAGVTGAIKIRVVAQNIAGDGIPGTSDTTDQDFALLVSNAGPARTTGAAFTHTARTVTKGGDGDAYVEPGEPFSVTQGVRNVGNVTATSVAGTLSGTHITTASGTWPNLAPQASASSTPFNTTLSASHVCGIPLALKINITSSGGGGQIPFTQAVGRPATTATTRTATDVPKSIPDADPAGVTSVLTAGSTGGTVSDLDVTIGSLTHTWVGDLVITLTSPAGTTVRLADPVATDSGDNFTNTVLDDEAATSISSGTAPFTGSFRPLEPLSAFDGQPIAGQWKLKVVDEGFADTGTLNSWNTKTKGFTCS